MPDTPRNEAEKRKLARLRRQNVMARMPARPPDDDADFPTQNFRVDLAPLLVSGLDTGEYEPLFVPNLALRDTQGRYPGRELVKRLRQALAVHTLIAHHGLKAILKTTTAAIGALESITPVEPRRLLSEGRRLLPELTMLRSEDELRRYSEKKYAILKAMGAQMPENLRSARVAAEISAVELLSIAYQRAQIIFAAFEKAQRADKQREGRPSADEGRVGEIGEDAHAEIQAAFDRFHPELHVGSLWEIAIYADVNPTVLWPQHIRRYAQLFEVARFIGRVDRGVEARLVPSHFDLLAEILREFYGPHNDDRDAIAALTREKCDFHFRREYLLHALDEAQRHGAALVAARETRALAFAPATPAPTKLARRFFDALVGMVEKFMPRARTTP